MFRYYEEIIRQMEKELERLANETFGQRELSVATSNFWQPRVDVYETKDRIWVKMEISGARADQIRVSLSPDHRTLIVSGTRDEETVEIGDRLRCYQLEILYGPFERVIHLPSNVPIDADNLSATYKDGFLIVVIPKKAPEGPRVIPIE
jgi:HSP20 family protein